MGLEPERFFIGVIDLFSVVIPGAIATYLAKDTIGPAVLGADYHRIDGTQAWLAFFFAAYLIGHFIFFIGSRLVDDFLFAPLRNATYGMQIQRLARGKSLAPWAARRLADVLITTRDTDNALQKADAIRRNRLDPIEATRSINTFQWSKAILRLESPAVMTTVERLEADSKFFRSFFVLMILVMPWIIATHDAGLIGGGVALTLLSFVRYFDQRVKATTQAYWYVLAREGQKDPPSPRAKPPRPAYSHAGGVVVRNADGIRNVLVVAPRHPRADLPHGNAALRPPRFGRAGEEPTMVLPKGHIEPGESPEETAVREVREETGVWARVTGPLETVSYDLEPDGSRVRVAFFAMDLQSLEKPIDKDRKHEWRTIPGATAALPEESRDLLLRNDVRLTLPENGTRGGQAQAR